MQKLEHLIESGTYFMYFLGFLVKKEIENSGTRTQAQKKKKERKKERKQERSSSE